MTIPGVKTSTETKNQAVSVKSENLKKCVHHERVTSEREKKIEYSRIVIFFSPFWFRGKIHFFFSGRDFKERRALGGDGTITSALVSSKEIAKFFVSDTILPMINFWKQTQVQY